MSQQTRAVAAVTQAASDHALRAALELTCLKADATWGAIDALCGAARDAQVRAVCVNPRFVAHCAQRLRGSELTVVSVVGFPLGATLTAVKAHECALAAAGGAGELDMVLDLAAAKSGRWDAAERDIRAVVEAAAGRAVKVIIETALLDDDQKRRACEAAVAAGAGFVKTCTGFAGGGANEHDVRLMRAAVGARAGVKASGGIRSRQQALALLAAGAERIGTSSLGVLE